jgi:DNA replication protein DnaC
MNQKRHFLDHYFRMFEFSESDGLKSIVKDQPNEMKRHMILANIPISFYNYTLDDVLSVWSNDVANDEAIENLKLYYDNLNRATTNGTGLFLTGTHGLAKTTAAIVLLKKAITEQFTTYFIPMNDLVDFVTSGWKDNNLKLKYQYVMSRVDFLVVDDVGRNYNMQSSQSTQFLDRLFVTRCNQSKCTILTSKHGIDEKATIFNDELLSLLKSKLIELKIVGSDIRQEKSKTLVEQLKLDTIKKPAKIGKRGDVG